MRWVRYGATGLLVCGLLLAGCGDGDPAVKLTGVLHVSRGGTGQVYVTSTQESFPFADSVTVAVRGAHDEADEFTIYTFFGLSRLTLDEVPDAALVSFVRGLDPEEASSTEVPSSVVASVFHSGFDASARAVLTQDAAQTFEAASNGSFVLEARPGGVAVGGRSSEQRVRYAVVTLVDRATSDEALCDGSADYTLSEDLDQSFFGYTGNFGLNTPPAGTGGGPPPPPGGGSGGGSGAGGGDGPPSPPL